MTMQFRNQELILQDFIFIGGFPS